MEIYFKKVKYRFVKSHVDISDDLDKILQSGQTEGDIASAENNKNIHFKKLNDKIEVDFGNEHFIIDKEPICFFSDDNKLLFKIYDSSNLKNINKIREGMENKYDFFSENKEKINFQEILERGIKSIIIKLKNKQYDIFKPLCERLKEEGKYLEVNTNCFLPKESPSLLIDYSSKFKVIIDKRKVLIKKIIDFMKNDKKFALKIYGSNGIGKSVTFLYFMTMKSDYKIIYFNLKDIFKYKQDPQEYFKNALMKYYSSNNDDSVSNQSDNDKNDQFNFNYSIYVKTIKYLESLYKEAFIKGDLWDMIYYFCDYIEDDYNSLIIIDQYKSEYDDEKKTINLKKIIKKYSEKRSIKFIIASSLNDYTVKEDLITDLLYIFREQIEFLKSFEKSMPIEKNDIKDELFKDFAFDNFNAEMDINEDFKNVSLFNTDQVDDLIKIKKNEIEEVKNNIIIKNDNEKKIMNKYVNTDKKIIESTEIIYINNLVSVEEIIKDSKDSDDKKLYEIFNFSPEAYTKYNFIHSNSNLSKNILYKSFLDSMFEEIDEKVEKFYKNLKNNKYITYSSYSLKYTFLMKLREIIENKVELNLKELIQYLEVFPFKYLKIYLSKNKSPITDNIIYMDERLKNAKFILDYSNDYMEIAFSKILYQVTSSTLIDMRDLTGSGVGPLIENKIKNNLVNNEFIIRYLWDFITPQDSIDKEKNKIDKYIFDYTNYKKNKLEYDEFLTKIDINYNKFYYIVPGSQTNRLLDSVILQPFNYDSFNMISLQITKFKLDFPTKEDYIRICFNAKEKFEKVYKIKINKMYFYFILAEDFQNEKTKEELELKNIAYFYYSIKEEKFKKKGYFINLENLNNIEAEISQNNQDYEYRYFDSKIALINCVEKYLQKKRRLDKDFQISQKYFEAAKNHLFKKTCNIHLDSYIKKEMKTIIEKNCVNYKSFLFTFQFVFYIYPNESLYLNDKEDFIGVMIQSAKKKEKGKDKLFRYFYKEELFPNNIDLPGEYFNMKEGRRKKFLPLKGEHYISKIDSAYWNRIFVFKIYQLNN